MKFTITLMVTAGLGMVCPALASAEAPCADLAKASLAHAQVTSATDENIGAGMSACRISVTSKPTSDSDIRIEIWIPRGAAWNGKFVQAGNGGFAGVIPQRLLQYVASRGYAVAGTDDGHQSKEATDGSWALGHPEKLVDFGWRALKETTEIARALIAQQKGDGASKSYFYGCSDGGREALMEAQRFPGDFDGIVAGAPANYLAELIVLGASNAQASSKEGAYLGEPELQLLEKASNAACGGGSFIRDPASCRFDPAKLACKPGQDTGCLSAGQVATAQAIYAGWRDPRTGDIVFPGFSPGGEAEPGGWAAWTTGPTPGWPPKALGPTFVTNGLRYFAFANADYDVQQLGLGAEAEGAVQKMAPVIDSASPDLSAFREHGGKLIQFHGWNDPAIPTRSSIRYYEDVRRTMGDPSAFYRMYLVPGMLHCGGGASPGYVDWLGELDHWVTSGQAPEAIVAKAPPPRPGAPQSPVTGSQLLCPYPDVASKNGDDPNDAADYRCARH